MSLAQQAPPKAKPVFCLHEILDWTLFGQAEVFFIFSCSKDLGIKKDLQTKLGNEIFYKIPLVTKIIYNTIQYFF